MSLELDFVKRSSLVVWWWWCLVVLGDVGLVAVVWIRTALKKPVAIFAPIDQIPGYSSHVLVSPCLLILFILLVVKASLTHNIVTHNSDGP